MTLLSVGPNVHDLPDAKAVEFYEKYSTGSNNGNKVYMTEDQGNMKLILKGRWMESLDKPMSVRSSHRALGDPYILLYRGILPLWLRR
jgi:hypothetical protein